MTAAAEPVAVVGLAVRFADVRDVEDYWRSLLDGRECAPAAPDPGPFEADLFGMTDREAKRCDPRLRVLLELCHGALEHAGYDPFAMPERVGVFVTRGAVDGPDQLAKQVAHRLGLSGSATTLPADGTGDLAAVPLACRALRLGECAVAVAAGGGAAVILKRLDDAYAGGDQIRAVILDGAASEGETGIEHADTLDGSGPAVVAGMAVTGGGVALAEAGYPETSAAGMVGLVTTVLVLEREAIPPTVRLRGLGSLTGRLRSWRRDPDRRRVVGVTGSGESGVAVRVLVAEGPPVVYQRPDGQPRVVMWSSGTAAGEQRLRSELGQYFGRLREECFVDAVGTLQYGRSRHRVRGATVCGSAAAAAAALSGSPGASVVHLGEPTTARGSGPPSPPGGCRVVFLVPDDGPLRPGLARGLYGVVREFTVPMDECVELFEQHGLPFYKLLTEGSPQPGQWDAALGQPLLFAVAYALGRLWRQAGVEPAAVIGEGTGRLAAGAITGALPLVEAVRRVVDQAAAVGRGPARLRPAGPARLDARPASAQPPEVLLALGPALTLRSAGHRPDLAGAVPVATLGEGLGERGDLLNAAAQLWVHGCLIDWAALDQPRPLVRLAVPGYPHQRNVAGPSPGGWAAATVRAEPPAWAGDRRARHQGLTSAVWQRELGAATDWILDEHRLGRVPLLPGTALLDLAVQAFQEQIGRSGDPLIEVTEVVFREPFLDQAPRLLRITLHPAGERHRVELESRPAGGGAWRTHATARIGAIPDRSARWDLAALRARFDAGGQAEPVPVGSPLLTRGPRWRTITGCWGIGDERLLRIELPPAYHPDLAAHVLHPALLGPVTMAMDTPGVAAAVPVRLRRLVVHARLPARLHAHVRRTGGSRSGETHTDADLIADDSSLLVQIEGLTMAVVEPERSAS